MNTLCVLSRGFGINTRLLTKIGDDEHGRSVLRICHEAQIDTSTVIVKQGLASAVSYMYSFKQHFREKELN